MTAAAPRAWFYLQERFPLPAHGPLVLAFAGGVACASAALRGADGPGWAAVAAAFVVSLGAFFQLRVADEWKDREADARWRPERPVPRGLVTLGELTAAAVAVAVVQVAVSVWLAPRLLVPLALVWAWGAAMTAEFGLPDRLRQSPALTLVSHGLIVPLIDFYSVSADVLGAGAGYPSGVGPLVGVSLFGGMVVEVGRKVWAGADERPGVPTYSAAWGRRPALVVWAGAVVASLACGLVVLGQVGGPPVLAAALAVVAVAVVALGVGALWAGRPGRGRVLEAAAGLWTLGLYLTIGPLALLAS